MSIERLAPLLNVEDVSRSIDFYRDRLDFKVAHHWEDGGRMRWAYLERGEIALMLNELQHATSEERRQRGSYQDVVLYFYVSDADEMRQRLSDAGVAVGGIEDTDYGMREFYLRDPDGYELGFGSPLRK